MRRLWISLWLGLATVTVADMDEQPVIAKWTLNELEVRDAEGGQPLSWDAELSVGRDIDKLIVTTEGERLDGATQDGELQLLWSHAVAAFWDARLGGRYDFQPDDPRREWLVAGFAGEAPYSIGTEVTFFAGASGRTALRLEFDRELLLTQRLILVPDAEINLHGKDDRATGVGSGLSDTEVGLRLRYEIRRELAPYIGIVWVRSYGETADLARAAGDAVEDGQVVVGITAWY